MNDKKSWLGSLVISGRSARRLGYVKEIACDPDSNHENLIVVPFSRVWLPKEITGACQFSSDAVGGFGDGCLIVNEPDDIRFISQSDLGKKLVQRTQVFGDVATGVTRFLVISLLLLPISPLLLVWFAKKKSLVSSVSSFKSYDDEDNPGLSPMRQPRSPGPLPTTDEALALPLVDSQKDTETYPMTRFLL